MKTEILADTRALATAAAHHIAAAAADAITARGHFTLALSGGSTPWLMLEQLAGLDLDWSRIHVLQVDERIAPDGDPARNWSHIETSLLERVPLPPANQHPMPVALPPEQAARQYSKLLDDLAPDGLDLVQLGLGDDGHTASLVPGDPALEIQNQPVAHCGPYRGHERLTLTFPALAHARHLLWLVAGEAKAPMLARLLTTDPTIPAGRVARDHAILFTDRAAMTTT